MTQIRATGLIYKAAQGSDWVADAPMGKRLQYGEDPPKGRSEETEALKLQPAEGICWLCGGDLSGKGVSLKNAIRDTFTDHDLAEAPWSNYICHACAWCLSWKYLRNYSIIANGSMLLHPDKKQIRTKLLSPPEPPFVFIIAVSGQKWLHFKSPVNYERDGYIAMLEEIPVRVDRGKLKTLIDMIIPMLSIFSKAEIQSGNYAQNRIKQYGIGPWQEHEKFLSQYRGAGIFDLALHVSQKEEE